jgi:hypothetical protein
MRTDVAKDLVRQVRATTAGWDDESIKALSAEIMSWRDETAATNAVFEVIHSHTDPRRPNLSVFVRAYNRAFDQLNPIGRPASNDGPFTPMKRARELASAAYAADCKLTGKEPNWPYFDRVMGTIGQSNNEG